uniref:KIB1-4 beta-propeller domain-containing protein n=1 Tax=Arundo donax TaxID=35708 RepID=A0A0A8XT01_ARUDO
MPYLVERGTVIPTGRNKFNVFKTDFQQSKWTEVTTIGDDQVLFLRRRCSRFVCVSQSDLPGDCIVFLENDDEDHNWYDKDSSNSCSVYNMRDGKVSTLLPMISWKHGFVHATWLFPQD